MAPFRSSPGRATDLLLRDDLVLGLDIGGTKLAAGVVAGDGRVLSQLTIPARKLEGPDRMIARLVDLGREAVDVSGVEWSRIGSIGIACGGPLDPVNGIILTPPNLPGWDEIPLAKVVGDALDRRVAVDNDATAAAVAEWWYGAGRSRDVEDLIYLTISTGVGGGVIVDGELFIAALKATAASSGTSPSTGTAAAAAGSGGSAASRRTSPVPRLPSAPPRWGCRG